MDMKKIILLFSAAVLTAVSCGKDDEYLPPDWNYPIPQTTLASPAILGAVYNIYTTADWKSVQDYVPELSIVYDEQGAVTDTVPYTATQDGIITAQCALAKKAGIDFFLIPWNDDAVETNFVNAWDFYWTADSGVKLVIKYNFSHLHVSSLELGGADFEAVVADFKTLYANLFSKDWYYHLPSGRPVVVVSGMADEKIDWEGFLTGFREAMTTYASETGAPASSLDFFFIGENTTNWAAPQTNESTAKWLDANYVLNWYPTTYYERWACFYPFTDMAWQNWRDYAKGWGNEFIPCIYPEAVYSGTKDRYIERTEKNYTDFCNVAKRNIGTSGIVMINSWNDFSHDSALEPAKPWGEKYLDITRRELKQ